MAAPAETQSPFEVEQTHPPSGLADRTMVSRAPGGLSRCGFGPPLAAGEVGSLGPYRIVRQLGKGGMGAVYAAIDTRLDRKLALKVMLPEAAADADAKERFLREARAAAQISHDNVVTVYEADERDGVPYIAMQFLEGSPLDAYLKRKGVPSIPQTMRIAREAAAGLDAAHKLDLVHRDIKPGNLWLEAPNGRVKVLDFGLAKAAHAEVELTQSGMVVGTPAYMSPEQARGLKVDGRSDLFSLGAVLYRLCTDRLPFDGPTTMAVLLALGADEPRPVRELNPEVPEPLAALIHQMLAKNPDERPQSAAEVVKRLQAIANGTGASNVVVTPSPRVVYVPVQVTGLADAPPFANPFADLDATESELLTGGEGAAPAPAAKGKGRRPVSLLWPAVALGGFLGLCGAAALIATRGTGPAAEKVAEKTAEKADPAPKNRPAPAKAPNGSDADRAAAEWVLSAGGSVGVNGEEKEIRSAVDLPKDKFALTAVNVTDRAVTDADLARLKECRSLTRLILHGTRVTDAGVAHLAGLSKLTELNLSHCAITDAGLAHLKNFPELALLWLTGTAVTDAGLVVLKDLPAIERLDLIDTRISGPGLVHLKNTRRLRLLLDKTAITDADLVHLKGLTGLVTLALSETAVTDAGLLHLRDLKGLGLLFVRQTRTTPGGLEQLHTHLRGCRIEHTGGARINPVAAEWLAAQWVLSVGGSVGVNGDGKEIRSAANLPGAGVPQVGAGPTNSPFALTRVNLSDRPITDNDLARLVHCKNLTELVLHGTKVTDAGVSHLRSLPQLRFLSLTGTATTDAGLANLTGMTGLTVLHLSGTKVTGAGFAHLANFPELTHLLASGLDLTDAGVAHLKGLTRLQALELNDAPVSDAGLEHLAGLTALRSLCLERTRVTGPGLAHLRDLAKLEHLAVTESPVKDDGVAHLSALHSIQHLYLNGTGLTDAGVPHVRKIKGLFVVNLSDTAVTDAGLMVLSDHGGMPYPTINNKHLTKRGVLAFHAVNPGRVVNWSGGQIAPTDPDRAAALWVLAAGGKVQVNGKPSDILDPSDLPKDKFALTAALLGENVAADAELVALKNAKQLTNVGLRGSNVTDAGLVHLKDLPNLRKLRLDGTKVTDAGLGVLKGLSLSQLDVRAAGVTQRGVDAFRSAVPGCKVEFGEPEPKK